MLIFRTVSQPRTLSSYRLAAEGVYLLSMHVVLANQKRRDILNE